MTLEEALLAVWRQALDEHLNIIELDGQRFPVRRTQRQRLCQVDFKFQDQALRGLEQNPSTKSQWAELARSGQKVMQFLAGGRYIGNVADGKLTLYKTGAPGSSSPGPASAAPSKTPAKSATGS
jgi:hypothetical protein